MFFFLAVGVFFNFFFIFGLEGGRLFTLVSFAAAAAAATVVSVVAAAVTFVVFDSLLGHKRENNSKTFRSCVNTPKVNFNPEEYFIPQI